MISRRPLVLAAGAVLAVLVGVGGWLVLDRGGVTALWSDGVARHADVAPADSEAAGALAGGDRGGDEAGSAASAPPRVHAFAGKPDATPRSRQPSPTAPLEVSEGIAGCDYAYGDGSLCVPWQFPDGVTDKCAWLKERGFQPVKVNARDRHGLDRNGDGIGCGPGD